MINSIEGPFQIDKYRQVVIFGIKGAIQMLSLSLGLCSRRASTMSETKLTRGDNVKSIHKSTESRLHIHFSKSLLKKCKIEIGRQLEIFSWLPLLYAY